MELNEYQEHAIKTMKKDPNPRVALLYFSGAICGEAGEQFEVIKKHIRDGTPLDEQKLIKELGDVLWYIAALAEICDTSLEWIAAENLAKLKKRYPAGEYRPEDAHRER